MVIKALVLIGVAVLAAFLEENVNKTWAFILVWGFIWWTVLKSKRDGNIKKQDK
jgi:hypothetical protein